MGPVAVGRRAVAGALLGLALLGVLGRVLDDERRELVAHVDAGALAARLAVADDLLRLGDDQVRLRVLARLAEHELVDEAVEELAQLRRVVRAVHDVPVVLLVERRLRAELAPKELGRVRGRPAERAGHVGHVRKHSLDAIALALDLGGQEGHAARGNSLGEVDWGVDGWMDTHR